MRKKVSAFLLAVALLMLPSCDMLGIQPHTAVSSVSGGTMEVHFIDAGQADAIFIRLPDGKIMQIDAGKNNTGDEITKYIKSQGVEKIDYLIGTHPHEDHIGGLDNVIEEFEIGKIYMPRVSVSETPTTQTYEDVLTAVKDKGLTITAPHAGDVIINGEGYTAEVLSPKREDYTDLNEYSIAIKLTYGSEKFLFMGDAEAINEREIIDAGYDIDTDVLKLGHHGSSTSSTEAFLKKASPDYAVISCGMGNSYGHPHDEVLKRCNDLKINVLRTDTDGTIIMRTDGESIDVSKEK
ncbi:MAG TPA: MBL fold metallo-hydrolase [Firmicutes bacterium]|nr:MBL fold metallo-hydrolase [Bacillota bacterium]